MKFKFYFFVLKFKVYFKYSIIKILKNFKKSLCMCNVKIDFYQDYCNDYAVSDTALKLT